MNTLKVIFSTGFDFGNDFSDFVGESDDPSSDHKLTAEQIRLHQLHRQFSQELQSIERDIMAASMGKLRKDAAQRALIADDENTISVGFKDPFFDDGTSTGNLAINLLALI